jgi:hypothetical protein
MLSLACDASMSLRCCAFALLPTPLPKRPTHVAHQFRAPVVCAWSSFLLPDLIAVSSLADPSYLSTVVPFTRYPFLASRFNRPLRLSFSSSRPRSSSSFWLSFALSFLSTAVNRCRPFLWTPHPSSSNARPYDIFPGSVNYLLVDGFVITSRCPVTP